MAKGHYHYTIYLSEDGSIRAERTYPNRFSGERVVLSHFDGELGTNTRDAAMEIAQEAEVADSLGLTLIIRAASRKELFPDERRIRKERLQTIINRVRKAMPHATIINSEPATA